MRIEHNNFFFSESEMAHINEIRMKHFVIDDFLDEACRYIETLGVKVEMTEIPYSFKLDGQFGPGWYGNWAGTYTNLISSTSLYSGTPIFDGNWFGRNSPASKFGRYDPLAPLEAVLVGNSGSGGGGSSFSYDTGFIAIETLPRLKEKMFSEVEISKATEELNSVLKVLEDNFKSDVKSTYEKKMENSEDYQYIDKKIKELEELTRELSNTRYQMQKNFEAEATIESAVDLPPIKDSLLDLKYYHKVKKQINEHNQTDIKVFDLTALSNKIYKVIDEFPHKFI